jgi:heterodisulfide reductase subunit D
LLFKPFEMGADGVLLLGCRPGACRYGTGSAAAEENTADTRQIMDCSDWVRSACSWPHFCPMRPMPCLPVLQTFTARIRQMGKSPVIAGPPAKEAEPLPTCSPEAIVATHDVFACQDCGKCTSACSLALAGKPFSPRFVAAEIIAGRADAPEVRAAVNSCLTCGVCYERCPSAVNFPEFIKDMRAYYHSRNVSRRTRPRRFFPKHDARHDLRNTGAAPLAERLPETIVRTRKEGPVLFFGGCAAYFDIFFRKFLGVQTGIASWRTACVCSTSSTWNRRFWKTNAAAATICSGPATVPTFCAWPSSMPGPSRPAAPKSSLPPAPNAAIPWTPSTPAMGSNCR